MATTTLEKWFLFSDLDYNTTDTTEKVRLSTLGSGYLGMSKLHLELLTGATFLTTGGLLYEHWETLSAIMASELYTKAGKVGTTSNRVLEESATLPGGYSDLTMDMISKFKRVGTQPIVPPT